jgi:2,4-dienoyl-CoA reductase (NADPH2)
MEAARVAALRNHNVLLCEKSNRLGGQANIAAIPPTKGEIKNHVEWLSRQIEKLGVEIRFGKEMSAKDVIAENADAVIIATGALPVDPSGFGAEGPVKNAWEVLEGRAEIGENVVIVGGGQVGLETSEYLVNQGKSVTVLEALPEVGQDMELFSKVFMLPRLASAGVTMVTEAKVEKIRENEVVADGKSYKCDTVVLAAGQEACSGLTIELEGQVEELYVIGDCDHPRKLLPAIHEGARAGRRI